MDMVSWTFDQLDYDVNKPILIDAADSSYSISASQARRYVRQLIAGLRARGLQRGETICILTLSNIYYPLFFLAIVGAGAYVAGGNPGHTIFELEQMLSKCSVKYIITEPTFFDKAFAAGSSCGISPEHMFLYDGHSAVSSNLQSWRRLLEHGETDWDVLDEFEAASTPTAYYSTSGTTGAPKFAAVSHAYQLVSGSYIEHETLSKPYGVSRLISLPLMHAFAAPLVHCAALRCGTPTFILARFNAKEFVQAVSGYGITEFPVVPSMLIALTTSSLVTVKALKSVREVMCAGAPLSTSLAAQFTSLLSVPSARLVQLYGSTEAGWISSTPWSAQDNFPHSASTTSPRYSLHTEATPTVGVPCTDYQIRLLHSSSNLPINGANTPGALQVKAPYPFLYYLDAEDDTTNSFTTDGWLKTGDIASRDDQGRYYIVDREKDMIKVRGWQVAPAEIESILVKHQDIKDCAVIGIEDTRGSSGEVPWAFVTCKTGLEYPDVEDLKSFVRRHLAGYKVPANIKIVESIPRNPAGKILRRVLREQHLEPACPMSGKVPGDRHAAIEETGSIIPSPATQSELSDVLPAWFKGNVVRTWPGSRSRQHDQAVSLWRDDRWRLALTVVVPGTFILALCASQIDIVHYARRWWSG